MRDDSIIAALDRLYQAEFRCPTARLGQAMPYIPWQDAAERHTLQQVVDEDREHIEWLTQLIVARGFGPPPASFPVDSAAMHYVRLAALLPGMIRAERELLSTYQAVAPSLADDPEAARRVSQIMSRHTRHLETFESLRHASVATARG